MKLPPIDMTKKTKEEKRDLGAFYTKEEIITDYMVSKLPIEDGKKVLEPCVGDGEFIRALNRVSNNLDIIAFDIDENAIDFIKSKTPNIKSQVKNTLIGETKPEYDLIIGNPPYGAKITKDEEKIYKKEYGEINITESYALFLINSIRRLKEGGVLSFIISDTFLHLNNHLKLRRYILQNCKIREIILLKTKLFPEVNYQYAGICIISLQKCSDESVRDKNRFRFVNRLGDINQLKRLIELPINSIPEFIDSELINQSDYLHFIDNIFFQAGIPKKLSSLFLDHNKLIGDLVSCKTGIYSGDNKKHFRIIGNSRETKKFVNAGYKTISKDEITYRKLNDEEKKRGILSLPCFVPLMKGGSGKYYKKPIWFIDWSKESLSYMLKNPKARVQNSEYYFKKGICMSLINSNRQQARIMEEVIFDQSDNGYFCEEKYIYFFLGFFNSKLFNYLLKKIINPTANATVNYVKKVPVLIPSKEELEEINNLVNEIINKKKVDEHSNILKNEESIDKFFYKLYNLNQEEIMVVENFNYHLR